MNDIENSIKLLSKDPIFRPLVKKYGLPDFSWNNSKKTQKNYFQSLVRSIISQQVSGAAADSIYKKFVALYKTLPTPEQVLKTKVTMLRKAGISPQKASYLLDLALKFIDGTIQPKKFKDMNSSQIIEHLIKVKGVGEWTAHMFLIFTLNRPDILPTGDLGIKKGFKILYGFKSLPSHRTMQRLAKPWREHATIASWYLWRVADGEKS